MFLIECPHCQRRELRGYRGLRSLTNTENGIVLTADCTNCGGTVTVLTGRPTAAPATTEAGAPVTDAATPPPVATPAGAPAPGVPSRQAAAA
jgi:hypothetical protein